MKRRTFLLSFSLIFLPFLKFSTKNYKKRENIESENLESSEDYYYYL